MQRHDILYKCIESGMLSVNRFISNRNKNFQTVDILTLTARSLRYQYFGQWKAFLSQTLFYVFFLLIMTFSYNKNIGKVDGCYGSQDLFNQTCHNMDDQFEIIEQNLYHQYIASVSLLTIHTAINTNHYLQEMKVFAAEHKNSKSLMIWQLSYSIIKTHTCVSLIFPIPSR